MSCRTENGKNVRAKASKQKKGRPVMALTVKDLLEAGCHFGHQTKRWNPKMKEFVYGAKNGISIIDITKTIHQVADACNFLQGCVMKGGRILFVGTKRQAQQIVREASEATGMNYVMERWMGGTLTNNATIKKSIKKMLDIDATVGSENTKLKKKELAVLSRQSEKLHRDLDGIASMKKLPDAVVIVDVCHDEIAVKEARKLNIPIVAIVDTNGDPSLVDYPVAANDDMRLPPEHEFERPKAGVKMGRRPQMGQGEQIRGGRHIDRRGGELIEPRVNACTQPFHLGRIDRLGPRYARGARTA